MIKSKGKYWYKHKSGKQPFDKCKCGNFKIKNAKRCFKCCGVKKDGTFKKKPAYKKGAKSNGYILIFKSRHPRANSFGYIAEHVYIMEKKIGRFLKPNEVVHHKDGKRDNNKLSNLVLMDKNEHNFMHNQRKNPFKYGKYRTHYRDYCHCGRLKDRRSKKCIECYKKRYVEGRGVLIDKNYVVKDRGEEQ
jgi:hypothetical protein